MSKDTVLDIVGSPNRTEMVSGKEKWAYRFYVGENSDTVLLRQITFYNGVVINFGEDTAEEERIKSIEQDDERKAQRRRFAQEARAKGASPSSLSSGGANATPPEEHKTTMEDLEHENYYQDMTGHRGTNGAE